MILGTCPCLAHGGVAESLVKGFLQGTLGHPMTSATTKAANSGSVLLHSGCHRYGSRGIEGMEKAEHVPERVGVAKGSSDHSMDHVASVCTKILKVGDVFLHSGFSRKPSLNSPHCVQSKARTKLEGVVLGARVQPQNQRPTTKASSTTFFWAVLLLLPAAGGFLGGSLGF